MSKRGINSTEKSELLKQQRLGATGYNKQGCLMKIVEYNSADDVIVEFQDEYKYRTKIAWSKFKNGSAHNYYASNQYGGITGNKYPISKNSIHTKEYKTWMSILLRCFDKKYKQRRPKYQNVTCCEEWLYYPNFYEWIHKQENFEVWLNADKFTFALDKDILIKGNKVYGPDTCCLVPTYVNSLFATTAKRSNGDNNIPLGVVYQTKCTNKHYRAEIKQGEHMIYSQSYETPQEAFQAYKQHKEAYIKQVAQEEYNKGTISKKCYEAMMKWEVEIED
jgi:hypothetical protein